MSYIRVNWQDSPSEATPINAENLNHMEDGIVTNEGRLDALENAGIVNKFNNRSGNVSPAKGDYDIGQVSPSTGAAVGQIPIVRNDGTEEDPELNFHMEDVPSSGHKIIDQSGTELTQEPNMTFLDSHLSDNSTDDSTDIEIIQSVSESDWENVTEDGLYDVDIEGVDIEPASDEYVEVVGDGSKTWKALLNELYGKADLTKLTGVSYLQHKGNIYQYYGEDTSNGLSFGAGIVYQSQPQIVGFYLVSTNSALNQYYSGQNHDVTNNIVNNGEKITLYYGNKYSVIDLQTTANRCWMSDGKTSVEEKINKLTLKSKNITVSSNANGKVDLSLGYPSNIVVAVTEIGGYKIIPYSYQNGWYAVLCDNSGGTAFDSVPNTTVTLTVFYITNV